MIINTEKIYNLIDGFRWLIEEEKNSLASYVIIFGYVDDDDEPGTCIYSLYQYFSKEICDFVSLNDYTNLDRFDRFLYDLIYGYCSIYKIDNGNEFKKLFPKYSYDDTIMGTPINMFIGQPENGKVAYNHINEDAYLKSLFDNLCNTYSAIYCEYIDLREHMKSENQIKISIHKCINNILKDITNDSNTADITDFYNYLKEAISNYKIKKEMD